MTKRTDSSKPSLKKRLVVIDGANAIYRAFFAIPNLRAPDGKPTGAAYGFVTMLIKVLREEGPTHIAIASDPRGGSFRREIFSEYKAGRDAQPEDLTVQFPLVAELCAAFGVQMIEVTNFEADDVIATLVETAPKGAEVCIVSTDKDLMQLVRPGVEMLDSGKGRRIDTAAVEERFGVPPSQLLDMRALVGDPSDNIPGVKGIGEKGAAKLIQEYGTLDEVLANADQVKGKRAREGLQEHADDARMSRELSILRGDVPLEIGWDSLEVGPPDREKLRELYKRLGFTRLLDSLADEAEKGQGSAPAKVAPAEPPASTPVNVTRTEKMLGTLIKRLSKAKRVALHPIFEGETAVSRELVGLALAAPGQPDAYLAMSGEGLFDRDGISNETLSMAIEKLFGPSSKLTWIGLETKSLQEFFAQKGVVLPLPEIDVDLAAAMLDSSGGRQLSTLSFEYLGQAIPSWEDLAGRGARAKTAADLGVEAVSGWAARQARTLVDIADSVREALQTNELATLFDEIEIPLTAVLAGMERFGVRVDEGHLKLLSDEFEKELTRIEAEIYRLAGEEFLVGSPKQLQVILFEKLGLPILKKNQDRLFDCGECARTIDRTS